MIPTSPQPTPGACCRSPVTSATSPAQTAGRGASSWQAVGGGVARRRCARCVRIGRFGLGRLGFDLPDAFAATPIGAHDGILVNIVLYGGNDGLNTVVPYTNGKYYDVRGPSNGNLAIPAGEVLPLDGTYGLHPSLTYIKRSGTPASWPSCTVSAIPTPICRTSRRWRSG